MERTPPDDSGRPTRSRRARGEGSIYCDKNGQWWAALYQHSRQKRVRAISEKDAKAKLRDLKRQSDAGVSIGTGRVSVEDYLQTWLANKAPDLEITTISNYRYRCERYILPIIGGLRLDAVTTEHIEGLITRMRRDNVASSTVCSVYTLLNAAFKKAARERRIAFSPVEAVDQPKLTVEEITPLSSSEWAALAWAIEGHRLEALYHLTITLGLRKGEALGIRESDLDLVAGTLHLEQTVLQADNKVHIGGIKNDTPRTVPLTPRLVAMLRTRLTRLAIEREHANWQEHGLLFPGEHGQPQAPSSFTKHYASAKKAAGIVRRVRFHDLRHTTASWLGDLGISREIIGRLLGHSGEGITGRYIHIGADPVRTAVDLLERECIVTTYAPTEDDRKARATFRTKGGRKAA
jgi:integrase